MKNILLIAFALILLNTSAFSFAWRVDQLPNGNVYSCNNCHSAGGGSSLNPFGEQVASIGLVTGNVDWSALWDKDADGDGFTNGQELGDPNGLWVEGETPEISDPEKITRPWDDSDFPSSVNADNYFSVIKAAPNPFSNLVSISTYVKRNGLVTVEIIDSNGNLVKNLMNNYTQEGTLNLNWDGMNQNFQKVSSGVYFLIISQNDAFKTFKLIVE